MTTDEMIGFLRYHCNCIYEGEKRSFIRHFVIGLMFNDKHTKAFWLLIDELYDCVSVVE